MKLEKSLGFKEIFCLGCGAMISSGIFILPGIAYSKAGPAVILSYLLAGLLAMIGSLSLIELSTALPKSGGDYFFITRSLGPFAGTISGLLSWFAISLKTAFAIIGTAEVMHVLFGSPLLITSILLCAFFTFLNIKGTKEASTFEVWLVFGLFIILGLYVVGGAGKLEPAAFTPFFLYGKGSIIATTGFIFVSFGGLLKLASISEEVINPKKNIPLGLLAAVICITALYALMLVVTIGLLPSEQMASTLTPIADGARIALGKPGFILVTIASVLAFVTTAIAGLMTASRYPLGLSQDGLIPPFFGKVSKRYKTPAAAIGLTGLIITLSLLMDLETLVKSASTVIIVSYILTNLSVVVLREAKLSNYRPSFRVPLYPWVQIISVVVFSALIIDMGVKSVETAIAIIIGGILLYIFYGKANASKEYALVHLIERIVNKRITSDALEEELKDIIRERDEIVKDRFDHLTEDATVLDLDNHMEHDEFFEKVADLLAQETGIDKKEASELLTEREQDCPTTISDLAAIPHIILPGKGIFRLFLVRSKEGINFSDNFPSIKAVFILAGTADERHFHLQALAAIAQIVQNPDFKKRWLAAESENQLKDVVMLSKRYRH